jgi:vacuolar-type H+-ATPase subunit F/Vma7
MSIFVIGDKHTLLGFALVGVPGKVPADVEQARTTLDELLTQEDIDLILITEDLTAQMRDRVDDLRLHRLHPVIVEIPGSKPGQPTRSLRDIVQQVVGIRLSA